MGYKIYILRTLDDETPKYVGITSGKLNTRLNNHLHDIKRESCKNYHKKNCLSKYKESVIIEQIDSANSIEEMKEKEIFYIKKYRDAGIKLVNATDGGDGTYGYKHSKETIEKISGENNHRWGKPNLYNKEELGKKVEYSKDGENWILFNSITEAELELNIQFRKIKKICEGDYITFENYYFRYQGFEFKPPRKRKKNDQSIRKKKVEVFLNNSWVTYDSAVDTSDDLNLDRSKVILVCQGKRLTTGGFKFRYKGEDYKGEIKKSGNPGRKVIFYYNGKIYSYNSIAEASKDLNVTREKIYKLL
jgi:hypothetical protein